MFVNHVLTGAYKRLECLHIQHMAGKSILRNFKYGLKKVYLSQYRLPKMGATFK